MAAEKNSEKSEAKPLLKDAPPPLLAVSIVGVFMACFASIFPSLESIDEVARIETFTHRIFPDLISLRMLGFIRLAMALLIWETSHFTIFRFGGWTIYGRYATASKLKRTSFHLKGWKTLATFTHWSWIMLGLSFSLSAAITLDVSFGLEHHVSKPMLRAALICFEIAAPLSFLVSAVVTHSIWPQVVKQNGDLTDLMHPRTLLMHNANMFFSVTEVALLGGIPVRFADIALAPLFGLMYVIFSWSMRKAWAPVDKEGPQFIYHFLDTTVGLATTIALVILLVVLMVSYSCFAQMHQVLDMLGGGLLVHASAVALFCGLLCRVR
jgi:hypothetical protein